MTFDRICRLCLRQTPGLSSLFTDNGAQMFERLTSIKIHKTDLCVQGCLQCLYSLKMAYNIQQDLIKSDERFREMLKYNSQDELSALIKIEETTDNFVGLPSNHGETNCCLNCGAFLGNSSSYKDVKKHSHDLKLCDNCHSQTDTSSVDNKPVGAGLQQCNLKIEDKRKTRSALLSKNVDQTTDFDSKTEALTPILKTDENFVSFPPLSESQHLLSDFTPIIEDLKKPASARTKAVQKLVKKKVESPLRRKFSCDECKKTFTSQKRLDNHVHAEKRHSNKKPCPYCKGEFDTSNFSRHVAKHFSEPQICELCGKTYKNKEGLRTHMFYSHSERRYKCDRCDKVFSQKFRRDLHIRRDHDDNPTFVCDTCGQKFYSMPQLNMHKRTHENLRPYVCDFCKKAFSCRNSLKTHRRQHTLEAPYKCDLCFESFRQKISLRSHKKSKHNIVEQLTVVCKKCGRGFSSSSALFGHKRAKCN